MTVQCCVCRKYRVDNRWKKTVAVDGNISHTYCPVCKKKAMSAIVSARKIFAASK